MGARKEGAAGPANVAAAVAACAKAKSSGDGSESWSDRLAGKADGQFITVRAVGPHGSLQARRLSNGAVRFYWRYTYRGECRREEIGTYDNRLPPKQLKPSPGGGWTMVAAAAQAASLALLHDDWLDRGGYRAFVLAQERERAAQADQQATEAQASLQALVTAYWEHLRDAGRTSWRDVRNGLTLHVIKAHPELCVLPAKSITTRDILVVLRAIHAKGITRQVGKVRAWLRAAFDIAATADIDVKVSEEWARFGIEVNPVAATSTATIPGGADKRPLSADELRTYWQCIAHLPGIQGAALRLHLRLGAPRVAQLLRLLREDIQLDSLTLWDSKGRLGKARAHMLPLDASAREDIALLSGQGRYALSLNGGRSHMSYDQLRDCAIEAVGGAIAGFQLKRLRSGVETLLASLEVPKDIRGRLQSHGIGGVQDRHYDAHDYLRQKAQALQLLTWALEGKSLRPPASGRPASVQSPPTAVARGRLLRAGLTRRSLRAQQRAAHPAARAPAMVSKGGTSGSLRGDVQPDDDGPGG